MTNTPVKTFRLNTELVKELQKEATEEHRSLSNYVEYLLTTHPGRKKSGSQKQRLTKQK